MSQFEGYYAGTIATKNHNPGNLRSSPFQTGKYGGFAVFPDYETGLYALKYQIYLAASGKSRYYRSDMTLLEFFNVYAPPHDSNQPNVYTAFVVKQTGLTKDTLISDLIK